MNPRQEKTAAASASAAGLQPWNMFADFGRQQVDVATEGAGVLFRGFEAMRKIQEQAAHQAGVRHRAAAEKLRKGCAPAQMLEIQSELLRFDVEAASRDWQQLGAAAMEMQTELLGCTAHLADSDAVLETASAVAHLVGDLRAAPLRSKAAKD